MSCYDIPNVRYAANIYPKLTSYSWVKDKEVKWGIESNMFKIRVAGEFPEENKDTLIPVRYIESALRRGQDGSMGPDRPIAFGLDVARQGTDSSVFGVRYESGLVRILATTNKKRETETAGQMKVLYNEMVRPEDNGNAFEKLMRIGKNPDKEGEKVKEPPPKPPINVDDTGLGGGVTDMLIEDDFPVNGIITGESPDLYDDRIDHPELFLNKRAQYYWYLRTLFINDKIAIEDEEAAFELSKIRVEYLRSGKIKIVDKETLKKAPPIGIGRSPDRADMIMLACSKEVAESDVSMVRIIA
jgi:hypothetical protein